jgi:hypothetical protein
MLRGQLFNFVGKAKMRKDLRAAPRGSRFRKNDSPPVLMQDAAAGKRLGWFFLLLGGVAGMGAATLACLPHRVTPIYLLVTAT